MLNLFSRAAKLQPRRRTEEFAEQLDLVLAYGWRSGSLLP
jgi:hypothetical protein